MRKDRKFQATANVRFQLKERQVTAVKSLLLIHDVLAVLPTGKSLIFQSAFVVAKELLNSAKACEKLAKERRQKTKDDKNKLIILRTIVFQLC